MDRKHSEQACPECNSLSRRDFVIATGAAAAVAGLPLVGGQANAAPSRDSDAEAAVRRLFNSLSDEQKSVVALPFEDKLRQKISANWSITKASVGKFFDKDQQQTIHEVFRGVTSGDGYERFLRQMDDDWGGFGQYAVAIFGDPNKGPFEFELTGRHHTIRADGNSVPGTAFGGPIVYGHSKRGNSPQNLFSYQTKRANEVFKALDGQQRTKALLDKAPKENAVQLSKDGSERPGISGADLSQDQKELVAAVLRDIMQPYRKEDVDEVMQIVKAAGGMDKVKIAFYRSGDLDKDEVWDVWRLEGPALVCHFRGAPHVHAYINVAQPTA